MKYKVVTVGGTFDLLHKGHRTILRKAFEISERVVVGVTSVAFAQKSRNDNIIKDLVLDNGFVGRWRDAEAFLENEGLRERVEIVKIEDMFGPLKKVKSMPRTAPSTSGLVRGQSSKFKVQNYKGDKRNRGDMGIEAMIVTRETRENAEKINKWRKELEMSELDIVEVEMELAEDGKPISSRRIRNGGINREGVVYRLHKLWGRLPRAMRAELRAPLGIVIRELPVTKFFSIDSSKNLSSVSSLLCRRPLITIGDVSTKKLIEAGIKPDVVVFDLKVRRKEVFTAPEEIGISKDYQLIKINNPAGQVTEELYKFFSHLSNHVVAGVRKIEQGREVEEQVQLSHSNNHVPRNIFQRKSVRGVAAGVRQQERVAVWVKGEEDLAALPAILFAPLGAVVVYGLPPIGRIGLIGHIAARQGLVVVEVTEEKKEKAFSILQRFYKE